LVLNHISSSRPNFYPAGLFFVGGILIGAVLCAVVFVGRPRAPSGE
jgi:hypothetical protein